MLSQHTVSNSLIVFIRMVSVDIVFRKKKSEESFAARFAAKEAFGKAIGLGAGKAFAWRDVEVVRGPIGAPHIAVHGKLKMLLESRGVDVSRFHISLTHSKRDAIAIVMMK